MEHEFYTKLGGLSTVDDCTCNVCQLLEEMDRKSLEARHPPLGKNERDFLQRFGSKLLGTEDCDPEQLLWVLQRVHWKPWADRDWPEFDGS